MLSQNGLRFCTPDLIVQTTIGSNPSLNVLSKCVICSSGEHMCNRSIARQIAYCFNFNAQGRQVEQKMRFAEMQKQKI